MSERTDPSQMNNGPQKLQAMGFGELLDTTFSLYRAHFWSFLAITSVYCVAMLIVFSIVFLDNSVGRGAGIAIWIPTISVIFGVSIFVVTGLVFASAEVYLDGRIRTGAVLRQGMRRFFPCFIGSFLFGLIACLSLFLTNILFVVLIDSYITTVGVGGVNVFLLNFTGLVFVIIIVCFAGFFLPYWSFFVSTVSLEERSMRVGLRRSRELIRGTRRRVVGMVLAIFLLSLAIGVIFRIAFGFLLSLTDWYDTWEFLKTVRWTTFSQLLENQPEISLSYVLMYLINVGVDTFTMPIWVIGCTLLYFDQRIRKEGFDIEMMETHQGE